LDGALKRLGARIGEEHLISKGRIDQPLAQPFLLGNGEDVGGVPDLFGSSLEGAHQMRVAMAQRVHRDAGMKVEIVSALLVIKAHALAPLKGEFRPSVCAIERRHGTFPFLNRFLHAATPPATTRGTAATNTTTAPARTRVSPREFGEFGLPSQRTRAKSLI